MKGIPTRGHVENPENPASNADAFEAFEAFEAIAKATAPSDVTKDPPLVAADQTHRLALMIIEPREHAILPFVLRQFMHVYRAESDVSLTVVHGPRNRAFVSKIVQPWTNARMIQMEKDNLTKDEYSDLCCSRALWDHFRHASHVLVFQTDTWIFRRVPELYFRYSYVGAPWNHVPKKCKPLVGGNGGFSLRRVDAMIAACTAHKRDPDEAEDVFVSRVVPERDICPFYQSRAFSVEHVWYPNPVGMHQAFLFLPRDKFRALFDS